MFWIKKIAIKLSGSPSSRFILYCASFFGGVVLATLSISSSFTIIILAVIVCCFASTKSAKIVFLAASLLMTGLLWRNYYQKNIYEVPHRQAVINFTKQFYINSLERTFPYPESGLIIGLTAGGLDHLDRSWKARFRLTGTTHLVALSGYNVAIIVSLLSSFLSWSAVPRRWRLLIITVSLAVFCLVVEAQVSLIRASLMGWLVALAAHIGRPTTSRTILPFVASLMALQNPLVIEEVGWQLSFLATLGIIEVYPLLNEFLPQIKKLRRLREALLMSLSAEICVLPLILFIWQTFSVWSPLTNSLIALFVPVTMLFGFIGGAVGFVSAPLGFLLGLVGYVGAFVILKLITFFAAWPWLITWRPNTVVLILSYLTLAFIFWLIKRRLTNHLVQL